MIVTVSRQYGSDGEVIARSVAETLGLTLVDRELVHNAALEAGLSPDLLQRLMYSRERNMADEIIHGLGSVTPGVVATAAANPLLGVFSPLVSTNTVTLEEGARAVGEIIRSIAAAGNVMILGQGGQALLKDQPGALHVLFVAPLDLRVARVAEWHKLTLSAARRRVKGQDDARRDYLARYHNVRWLDPLLYDLVINTAHLTRTEAAALLARAATGAEPPLAGPAPAVE